VVKHAVHQGVVHDLELAKVFSNGGFYLSSVSSKRLGRGLFAKTLYCQLLIANSFLWRGGLNPLSL